MPDALRTVIERVRARLRVRIAAHAVTLGGAAFAASWVLRLPVLLAAAISVIAAVVLIARRWTVADGVVARAIEAQQPLDNLLITAAELDGQRRPVRTDIRAAILLQAAERAGAVDAGMIVPLLHPIAAAILVSIGCVVLMQGDAVRRSPLVSSIAPTTAASASNSITVRVVPPAYTKRPSETHVDPAQLTVVAGSQVRIASQSNVVREWVATASESLNLTVQEHAPSRFLSVIVVPDAAPSVRITEPGRDTAFAAPSGALEIGVESRDDLGLASLSLRYTKASGGGENVTFTDGDVPVTLERINERHWRARARWPLDPLGLADGDVLVYRAIARDANPGGAPVESDAFLVEIGRTAEIASAGFALPTEEKKYAISQQMVIYKTEQLLANRARHPDDWLEQTRMIGMEQRMVRAEVVFLSGGDVQDEVEEAAHSHELAEGRLENQGRAEMVRALNFMSRAEAQLNDGNAAEALVFERQALASLERALDRRRYFLRTLPDRSRIDPTRRLTGERREARSWVRDRAVSAAQPNGPLQSAMRELMAAMVDPSLVNAALAARVAGVDPNAAALQKAAVELAAAQSADERRGAVRSTMQVLTAHALTTLPGSSPVSVPADPLAGRLADALRRPPQ